ncbi:MAG: bacillithiol system redox-active protein YtxJ [Bacteroidia bacterium]|nr:bacillithiol system redox-active protein YtxJ [Bacteroidia bacterium]
MKNWQELNSGAKLNALVEASFQRPQLIFKHSIRCGISAHVLHGLQESTEQLAESVELHYLDLINFRNISNQVAADFNVPHQSPQVILIKDGKAVHNASHFSIEPQGILTAA